MKKRIKITKAPTYEHGGANKGDQVGYSMYDGGYTPDTTPEGFNIRNVFPEAAEGEATIEAEKGEQIMHDADGDGQMESFAIGGKRHEQGGTPIAADPGDFIFSDRKKLAVKGSLLENFGKSPETKKAYTPAELAKQYNINKYKAFMNDPEADPIQKKTAEMMITNYNKKLAELAVVQEASKGFPNGIPGIAMQLFEGSESATPEMKMGGYVKAAHGLEVPIGPGDPTWRGDRTTNWNASKKYKTLKDYGNAVGYPGKKDSDYTDLKIQQWVKQTYPDVVNEYHDKYGIPTGGILDSKIGIRWDEIGNAIDKKRNAVPASMTPFKQITHMEGRPGVHGNPSVSPTSIAQTAKEATSPEEQVSAPGMPWWTQDKINTTAAFLNRYNIRKQLPWEPVANAVIPDPTFVDPTRALASNAEQAAIQTAAASQFAGAQRQRGVNSSVQGQAAKQAADILSQYDTQNVGIANQFAGANAEIQNNVNMQNLASKKRLYDGNVLANENFDKEKKMANAVVLKNYINGMTNAQKTHWMNSFFDQFDIDPASGAINFDKANHKDFTTGRTGSGTGSNTTTAYVDAYMALKKQFPEASEEVLREQAKINAGAGRRTQTDEDGDGVVDKTRMLQQLLGASPMFGTMQ